MPSLSPHGHCLAWLSKIWVLRSEFSSSHIHIRTEISNHYKHYEIATQRHISLITLIHSALKGGMDSLVLNFFVGNIKGEPASVFIAGFSLAVRWIVHMYLHVYVMYITYACMYVCINVCINLNMYLYTCTYEYIDGWQFVNCKCDPWLVFLCNLQ
jgi:hypothetical protein